MSLTYEKVIQIINANIETTVIQADQIDDDLSQHGMDSIIFIRIIVALEEEFDIEIADEYLLMTEMNTVSKMLSVVSVALDIKEHE